MAISDQERREVAAKLRSLDEHIDGVPPMCSPQVHSAMALSAIRAVVGKGDIFHLLADFIDRPTGIATEESDGYGKCHTCGASFIVSVPAAFRCEEESEASHCPFCGTPLEWRYEDDR